MLLQSISLQSVSFPSNSSRLIHTDSLQVKEMSFHVLRSKLRLSYDNMLLRNLTSYSLWKTHFLFELLLEL